MSQIFLFNPVRDFLIIASKQAKQLRSKELNLIEAEIMMAEESVIKLKQQGISPETLNALENKLEQLKNTLKNKRKEFENRIKSSA